MLLRCYYVTSQGRRSAESGRGFKTDDVDPFACRAPGNAGRVRYGRRITAGAVGPETSVPP